MFPNVKQCPSLKAHLGFNPPLANVSKESVCDWWTLSQCSKDSVPSAWLRASQERKGRREKHQVRGVWIRDQEGFRTGAIHQHLRTICIWVLRELILTCWICFKGLVNGYIRTWRHSPHLDFDWKGNYYTLLIPRSAPPRGQRTCSWENIEGLCSPSACLKIPPERHSGCILTRCTTHISWLLLQQRTSITILNTFSTSDSSSEI